MHTIINSRFRVYVESLMIKEYINEGLFTLSPSRSFYRVVALRILFYFKQYKLSSFQEVKPFFFLEQ